MNAVNQNFKPSFGGHEKFVFRYGWLKKGVDAVADHPAIFRDDDALVTLGVGKNMVRAIRHWCVTLGLIEAAAGSRMRDFNVSELGMWLMQEGDPFLEDVGTLWLLHWQLASNVSHGLIWYLIFSYSQTGEITKQQLQVLVERQLKSRGIATTSGMIEREVDCFLRTYITSTRTKQGMIVEESLDCPLSELDLIRYSAEDNVYRFNVGAKPTLPLAIFAYSLLTYLSSIASTRRTVALDECIYQPGSPGQLFKLDENTVVENIETLGALTAGTIQFQDTAGLRQLYLHNTDPDALNRQASDILRNYYE